MLQRSHTFEGVEGTDPPNQSHRQLWMLQRSHTFEGVEGFLAITT